MGGSLNGWTLVLDYLVTVFWMVIYDVLPVLGTLFVGIVVVKWMNQYPWINAFFFLFVLGLIVAKIPFVCRLHQAHCLCCRQ